MNSAPQRTRFFLSVITSLLVSVAGAATLTVTSTGDNGPGTLRQAIVDARPGDTVTFSLAAGSAIALMSGPLLVDKNLTISGPGAKVLSVGNLNPSIGSNRFRIFNITGNIKVTLSGLTIKGGKDGGIFNDAGAVLTLTRCAILGNNRRNGSGGGIFNSGTMTVVESSISLNSSTGSLSPAGGGICNLGTASFTNCTISSNDSGAGNGGGIVNGSFSQSGGTPSAGKVTLTNCTISNNVSGFGGGVSNVDGGTVSAINTIIAGNVAAFENNSPDSGTDFYGPLISQGHNFIGSNSGATITPAAGDQIGTASSPKDPRLGPLQDNGGSTQTHALLAGSTAIDAGDDSAAPPRDQRQYLRSGISDIGAYEFNGTIPVTLANISSRARVDLDTSGSVLIGGFIITGNAPKKVVIRALGPSLSLNEPIVDPALDLHNQAGDSIAFNDNWRSNSNAAEIENSGLAPKSDFESALLLTLNPGAYTAIVSPVAGTTHGGIHPSPAIGLVEVYDLDRTVDSKLANMSTRGLVLTDDNVMIAGVIVTGVDPQKVIVRALGPSLQLPGHLLDPALELHDGNGVILALNDNWRSDQEAEIMATIPPSNDAESAIVRTLTPGNYTAIVRGVNRTTGIGLVEVYALP